MKENEVTTRCCYSIKKSTDELLKLCDGQPTELTLSILITAAASMIATADLFRELANERKDVWDFIIRRSVEDVLKETRK